MLGGYVFSPGMSGELWVLRAPTGIPSRTVFRRSEKLESHSTR